VRHPKLNTRISHKMSDYMEMFKDAAMSAMFAMFVYMVMFV
jgi:hypothetical protein